MEERKARSCSGQRSGRKQSDPGIVRYSYNAAPNQTFDHLVLSRLLSLDSCTVGGSQKEGTVERNMENVERDRNDMGQPVVMQCGPDDAKDAVWLLMRDGGKGDENKTKYTASRDIIRGWAGRGG